jgi:hypothetical protein
LGIPDIRILGYALRLRWEWQQRLPGAPAWMKLPAKPEKMITTMFASSVHIRLGDGSSVCFWSDALLPDGHIRSFAPDLFQAVGKRFLKVSVKDALFQRRWVRHITGARTALVLYEYVSLWEKMESIELRPFVGDRFIWKWTTDGSYLASSAYRSFFLGMSSLLGAKDLWKASAPPKVKFFFVLTLHHRIWTADRRMRHGLQDSAACALCDQDDETVDHLLVGCAYARELWYRLLRPGGWDPLVPALGSSLAAWWMDSRSLLPANLRRSFDSVRLLVSWVLWKERRRCSAQQAMRALLEEADD